MIPVNDVFCRTGATFFLVHRALFHQGCTCLGVHHAGSLKNKGVGTYIEITSSGELVTLRTVSLYNAGAHLKSAGGAELFTLGVQGFTFSCSLLDFTVLSMIYYIRKLLVNTTNIGKENGYDRTKEISGCTDQTPMESSDQSHNRNSQMWKKHITVCFVPEISPCIRRI